MIQLGYSLRKVQEASPSFTVFFILFPLRFNVRETTQLNYQLDTHFDKQKQTFCVWFHSNEAMKPLKLCYNCRVYGVIQVVRFPIIGRRIYMHEMMKECLY